jgi:putrescine aminotransferase
MLAAIELVPEKPKRSFFPPEMDVGTRCRNHCFANGLVMRAIRDTMVLAPPLVASEAEIDEIVAKAKEAIDRTARDLNKL